MQVYARRRHYRLLFEGLKPGGEIKVQLAEVVFWAIQEQGADLATLR